MRVKCVSGKCRNVTLGKVYDVIGLLEDCNSGTYLFVVIDDNGCEEGFGINVMKPTDENKEDKMEDVRVVRKLEDLDGLENGMGAELIYVVVGGLVKVVTSEDELTINSSDEYSDTKSFLDTLKTMGFKFDYKPLRTVHEVIQEIKSLKSLTFKQGELNYFVSCYEGKYHVEAMRETFIIGVNYMTKEQAQKYADELNEIIGVGK